MPTLANGMVVDHATILADGISLSTDTHETQLNNNLLVVGGSGSGKSSSVVMPNLMQINSSIVAIDPKGALHASMAAGLAQAGYDVELLDFANPARSTVSWNPFSEARDDRELHDLAIGLVSEHGMSERDPFWQEQAAYLSTAIVKLIEEEGDTPTMGGVIRAFDDLHVPAEIYNRPDGYPSVAFFSKLDMRFCDRAYVENEIDAEVAKVAGPSAEEVEELKRMKAEERERRAKNEARVRSTKARRVALRCEIMRRFGLTQPEYFDLRNGNVRASNPALRAALREQRRRAREYELAVHENRGGNARAWTLASKPRKPPAPTTVTERRVSEAYDRWVNVRDTASETWSCIVNVASPRVDAYRSPELLRLLGGETDARPVDLIQPGQRVTARFVVISDVNRDLDLLATTFVTQQVRALVQHADAMGEPLDQPVRLVLDDFATMAAMPDMVSWIAAVRSREIWITLVVQSLAQLEERYGKAADTIVGNCDTAIYFTPTDVRTARAITSRTGLRPQAVMALGTDAAWVIVRGYVPTLAHRYDLNAHPNWTRFWLASHMREATA